MQVSTPNNFVILGLFLAVPALLSACTINLDATGYADLANAAAGTERSGVAVGSGGNVAGAGGVNNVGGATGYGGAFYATPGYGGSTATPGPATGGSGPVITPGGATGDGPSDAGEVQPRPASSCRSLGAAGDGPSDAGETVACFAFTGTPQIWKVPAGVTSITVDVRGAQGGSTAQYRGAPFAPGGWGARVQATLSVEPGQTLQIFVGGAGGDPAYPNTAGFGGWNGGGAGAEDNVDFNGPSSGGGGASDIRRGGSELVNRVIVAAGGGGSEGFHDGPGAQGGGETGADGQCRGTECMCAVGGGGATLTSGGVGGTGCNGDGEAGMLGSGGRGGDGNRAGGGGGGGYFGGGGGGGCCLGAGGGAGSSFAPQADAIFSNGVQSGDGEIVITFANGSTSSSTADAGPLPNAGSAVDAGVNAGCASDGPRDGAEGCVDL